MTNAAASPWPILAAGVIALAVAWPEPKAVELIPPNPQPTLADDPAPRMDPPVRDDRQDADAGPAEQAEWLTWPEAEAEHQRTGRPVLVVLHFADPDRHTGCLPCLRLEKTLADPGTFAAFAELGIPCQDTAERWHGPKAKVTAPAIVFYTGDAKPRMLKGFPVGPPETFLAKLKEWIDATP